MIRIRLMGTLTALLLLIATAVFAQSGSAQGSAQSNTQGNAQVNNASNSTDANATLDAMASADAKAKADAEKLHQRLIERSAKVSARAREKAEAEIETTVKATDEAAETGESEVASRLAADFGMTADAIMSEKSASQASWGNLMIAHTLAANSKTDVTASQLLTLQHDGMGWGQIAAGLGYDLGSAVRASKAESKVAAGEAKADGRVAVINGEGAKAGAVTSANINATAGHAKVGAGVNVGAGVKIGH